jgi:mutator protein MutT
MPVYIDPSLHRSIYKNHSFPVALVITGFYPKDMTNSKMIIDSILKRVYYSAMKKGLDYIGVGAGAVIFNKDGKVFLAKRGLEAQNEKQKWEFPGGSVEFGETLENALVREIREEYGFVVEVLQLLDVVNHILPEEKQHWISPTYLCRYKNGKPSIKEPHKCEEIGWFNIGSIPIKELSRASQKSLQSLRKYLSAE